MHYYYGMANTEQRIKGRMLSAKSRSAESTRKILASKYKVIGEFFATGITQAKVEEYIASRLECGIKTSTINYELACIRTLLIPEDKVKIQMLRDRERRNRVYLTESEISALLEHMSSATRAMAMAYLYTGCRLEELRAVTASDLLDRPGFVRIHNQKTARSGYDHTRYVPVRPEIAALLPLDRSVTPTQFRGALRRAAKSAGIEICVTPKTFRSTMASTLVQRGAAMETVAMLLGHSSTAITQKHYAHLCPKNLQDAVALLPQVSCLNSTGDAASTVADQ